MAAWHPRKIWPVTIDKHAGGPELRSEFAENHIGDVQAVSPQGANKRSALRRKNNGATALPHSVHLALMSEDGGMRCAYCALRAPSSCTRTPPNLTRTWPRRLRKT